MAHTFLLKGDFASAIEAYSGRGSYYLDAAAWAAVGHGERAASVLRQRLKKSFLSSVMRALMISLAILEGRTEDAVRTMERAEVNREPEIVTYFARHYSFLGFADDAAATLNRAADAGFICAPETLRRDPWLAGLRKSAKFKRLLRESELRARFARDRFGVQKSKNGGSSRTFHAKTANLSLAINCPQT